MQAILGILVVIGITWVLSEQKHNVKPVEIVVVLVGQIVLAALLLRAPVVAKALGALNVLVQAIGDASREGTSFVFGYLGGGDLPFELQDGASTLILATQLLPQILVFSVLVALLWYWRVLPLLIKGISWSLQRFLKIGGSVAVAAAASIFVGMVESPMIIRGYLKAITRAEFFIVITCGMSTVAGTIMVLYVNVLGDVVDVALGHILTASILNVLGAILIARIMVPDSTVTDIGKVEDAFKYESVFDALTRGASDGTKLVINIIAMLIVLISLLALINQLLSLIPTGGEPLTLQGIVAFVFLPLTWCMGIPWAETGVAGQLMGTKLVVNEFVAYQHLGEVGNSLIPRSRLILTYALCGFTNIGSVGILIGGVSALVPDRRTELLSLAPRTLISGTLVAVLTGSVVGIVTSVGQL